MFLTLSKADRPKADRPKADRPKAAGRGLDTDDVEIDLRGTGAVVRQSTTGASPLPSFQRKLKRTMDIVLSVSLGAILSPLLIVAIVAIKLFSQGPVLFRQTRVGRNGTTFTMFKLRTMTVNNDDSEHRAYVAGMITGKADTHDGKFKLVGDARITRVGRILRRYSIDEIPQMWNVIKGDMSLVGPRPALVHEVALYDERAWQRLRVRPGLTGLWQVSGRCRLTFDEMVELDVKYWTRWNLLRDIAILFRTPAVVVTARGAA